jgi:hypothetical protein
MWAPIFAVAMIAIRRVHRSLGRRGVRARTSTGIAATVGLAILVAYIPVYTVMLIGLFDWLTAD